jgi:hypothetical protein
MLYVSTVGINRCNLEDLERNDSPALFLKQETTEDSAIKQSVKLTTKIYLQRFELSRLVALNIMQTFKTARVRRARQLSNLLSQKIPD